MPDREYGMTINILAHLENESGVNKFMAWSQAQRRYQSSIKGKEARSRYMANRKARLAEAKQPKETKQVEKSEVEGKIKIENLANQ